MYKVIFSMFILSLLLASCSSEKQITTNLQLNEGENIYYFYYLVKGTSEELIAEPVKNLEGQSNSAVLNNIMIRLTEHFNKGNTGERLEFQLQDFIVVKADTINYPVAVVNINDPGNHMKKKYFQGSTGGMHTQNTILFNILQPQTEHFLDGVIILINNEPVGEMDHVYLTGILVPGQMSYTAEQAIRKTTKN